MDSMSRHGSMAATACVTFVVLAAWAQRAGAGPAHAMARPAAARGAAPLAAQSPDFMPCTELPPVPNFSAAFCAALVNSPCAADSKWQATGGPPQWTTFTSNCGCREWLVPAKCCSANCPGPNVVGGCVGRPRIEIANTDSGAWARTSGVGAICSESSRSLIDLGAFPADCGAGAFPPAGPPGSRGGFGSFYVSANGRGLCCETADAKYCKSLDTTLPACCVGAQRASLRFSETGLAALATVEGVATQAYYDIWGVLTIGIGYTASCGCLPATVKYASTMCKDTALAILRNGFVDGNKLAKNYADPVKAWMASNAVECLPQPVFDALVMVKYNCGSCLHPTKDARAKDIVAAVKKADWAGLAAIINARTYMASAETKRVAALLITDKFTPPAKLPALKGVSRCQPYGNGVCPGACGSAAWTQAKAAANPARIVVPGANATVQRICDRCVNALKAVKGPGGCKAGDKFLGADVPC